MVVRPSLRRRPHVGGREDAGLGLPSIIQPPHIATIPFPRLEDTRIEWSGDVAVLETAGSDPQARAGLTRAQGAGLADASTDASRWPAARPTGRRVQTIDSITRRLQPYGISSFPVAGTRCLLGHPMETFVELALLGLRFDLLPRRGRPLHPRHGWAWSVQAPFDLTMRWSSRGLSFSGSGGLHVSLPLQQAVGPVKLDAAHIGDRRRRSGHRYGNQCQRLLVLGPSPQPSNGSGVTVALLPGKATWPLRPDAAVQPPDRPRLVVTTPGSRGGFLGFDPQRAEYSGMLQLGWPRPSPSRPWACSPLRMPDGSCGYSLIVILTAEGFAPIPLGLGFTSPASADWWPPHRPH